eukprot:429303_1
MSNIKPAVTESISVIPGKSPPTSIIKSELAAQSQPPSVGTPDRHNMLTISGKSQISHIGVNVFSCEIFPKIFTKKGAFKQHLFIHNGIKRHSCDVCQMDFRLKGDLNRHHLVHSGAKPYSCDICQTNFRHLRT